MESYRTDEEQIEALRKWWDENGKSTLIGIVAALVIVFGWQGWQKQQESRTAEASSLYQTLLEADAALESGSGKIETAEHLATTLKSGHGGSVYGVFAAMHKAKYAAMNKDWEAAEAELNWVIQQRPEQALLLQARIRLAQVLLSLKKYEQAEQSLAAIDSGSYAALVSETRGDILLAQDNKAGALEAYLQAKTALDSQENASANPLLEMKIADLQTAGTVGVSQ